MEWWQALSVDPGDPNVDQYQEWLITGIAIFIATAIVIFFWRVVKGMKFSTVVILVAMVFFLAIYVIPNMRG